eukprot:724117-Rhodomonas_salina.3
MSIPTKNVHANVHLRALRENNQVSAAAHVGPAPHVDERIVSAVEHWERKLGPVSHNKPVVRNLFNHGHCDHRAKI